MCRKSQHTLVYTASILCYVLDVSSLFNGVIAMLHSNEQFLKDKEPNGTCADAGPVLQPCEPTHPKEGSKMSGEQETPIKGLSLYQVNGFSNVPSITGVEDLKMLHMNPQ